MKPESRRGSINLVTEPLFWIILGALVVIIFYIAWQKYPEWAGKLFGGIFG